MGKTRGKGAIAGYVPGPFGTDSGRFWTVLDVIGRYLDHRFSWFDGNSSREDLNRGWARMDANGRVAGKLNLRVEI
jgi:hypothetical protein